MIEKFIEMLLSTWQTITNLFLPVTEFITDTLLIPLLWSQILVLGTFILLTVVALTFVASVICWMRS